MDFSDDDQKVANVTTKHCLPKANLMNILYQYVEPIKKKIYKHSHHIHLSWAQ